MFSQLQGKRPVAQQQYPSHPPLNQQPTRQTSQQPHNHPAMPPSRFPTHQQSSPRPRSQMEALPPSSNLSPSNPSSSASVKAAASGNPFTASQLRQFLEAQRRVAWDPSKTHPVFFTERVVKAPNGVVVGEGVGRGYIFEGGAGRRTEGDPRL